jgi:hypothetical protein
VKIRNAGKAKFGRGRAELGEGRGTITLINDESIQPIGQPLASRNLDNQGITIFTMIKRIINREPTKIRTAQGAAKL